MSISSSKAQLWKNKEGFRGIMKFIMPGAMALLAVWVRFLASAAKLHRLIHKRRYFFIPQEVDDDNLDTNKSIIGQP